MKTFTYHTLPVKIKEKELMSDLYQNNKKQWDNIYYGADDYPVEVFQAALCSTGDFYQNDRYPVIIWTQTLRIFGHLTQEIKEELLPYIYGEE